MGMLLESLFLIAGRSEEGKKMCEEGGVYLVIRELHLEVEDEGVRELCERLVGVLMGGVEEDEMRATGGPRDEGERESRGTMVTQVEEEEDDDDDDQVVEIF